ncbi:MAG: YtxH domain-containing protein [Cyclobacteriaceae bacterium]|nr:YtxH domain-containing protein [Cyclobacteriaceae bacterium]
MKNIKILSGIAAGALIGTAIGILFAPEEGRVTRKKILDEADKMADNILRENLVKNNK